MKTNNKQLFRAAINLLAASAVRGEYITTEDIRWAIDVAVRTAEEFPDDDQLSTPTDDECKEAVIAAFKLNNDKKMSKTRLSNTIEIISRVKKVIADYMISSAEGLGVIKSTPRGNCIDYSLV